MDKCCSVDVPHPAYSNFPDDGEWHDVVFDIRTDDEKEWRPVTVRARKVHDASV